MPQYLRIPRPGQPCQKSNGAYAESIWRDFGMGGEDLFARAFLHEIDHLNGILFINHLSALKRDLIKRKIKKLQKAGEWKSKYIITGYARIRRPHA